MLIKGVLRALILPHAVVRIKGVLRLLMLSPALVLPHALVLTMWLLPPMPVLSQILAAAMVLGIGKIFGIDHLGRFLRSRKSTTSV